MITDDYDDHALHDEPLSDSGAEEDVVLSDLVRTGEASRLRRRGAMRLDHILRQPSLRDSSDYSEWRAEVLGGSGHDGEDGVYRLWCGAEEVEEEGEEGEEWGDDTPWRPALLPWPGADAEATTERRTATRLGESEMGRRRRNGCGAIVHTNSVPRRGGTEWVGKGDAEDALGPLDASYGPDPRQAKRCPCGCVWEYFGCRVCGNLLGLSRQSCRAACAGSAFRRRSVSSRISHSQEVTYTFYDNAVTAAPASSSLDRSPSDATTESISTTQSSLVLLRPSLTRALGAPGPVSSLPAPTLAATPALVGNTGPVNLHRLFPARELTLSPEALSPSAGVRAIDPDDEDYVATEPNSPSCGDEGMWWPPYDIER